MKYHYLFCNHHNGHYSSYIPFTSQKNLTQEDANRFILMRNPNAGRIGSSIQDLMIVANDHGYDLQRYRCEYYRPGELTAINGDIDLDPLPDSFNNWKIINGILGNY